jgi:hypothetical protein
VVGVDSSPTLIALCRARFPGAEWVVMDMRQLDLGRRFDGILAWDSFFHLHMDDQRRMFARFGDHARPGAPLMFTSGTSEGSVLGQYHGEALYHASLDPEEYRRLLADNGFSVNARVVEDPAWRLLTPRSSSRISYFSRNSTNLGITWSGASSISQWPDPFTTTPSTWLSTSLA